jgi:ABC-type multidrug transport system fused ATPase/permease subunit
VTYYLTGGDMAPETVFVAVSLLVLIRFPLIMLPMTIGAVVMGLISVHRIERFLLMEDMPRFRLGNGNDGNGSSSSSSSNQERKEVSSLKRGAILVKGGGFRWAAQPPAAPAAGDAGGAGAGAIQSSSVSDSTKSSSSFKEGKTPSSAPQLTQQQQKLEATIRDEDEENEDEDGGDGEKGEKGHNAPPPVVSSWRLELQDFEVAPGTLVAVTGRVGAGKTSLLAALLNEMDPAAAAAAALSPSSSPLPASSASASTNKKQAALPPVVVGSVGYAAQQPWIMNATLRENVLFGQPFDEQKYREVG